MQVCYARALPALVLIFLISHAVAKANDRTFPEQQRALQAADYILSCQDPNGAVRDAHDNPGVNMDNNMNYAMVALLAAYRASGDGKYLVAVRRGLDWLASVQEADGAWHWGYLAPTYEPFVGESYRRLGISDIQGVDAIQAYFAYVLYLYVQASGDREAGETLLPAARRGIDYLLKHNYNGRIFYSSWQRRGNFWFRLPTMYSAGQADVYLGLMALWRLTGDSRYDLAAQRLKSHLASTFLRNGVWKTSWWDNRPYRFSNGYIPYVFGRTEGVDWLADNQDGSALARSVLALGLQANDRPAVAPLTHLGSLQGPHGGIAFSSRPRFSRYYYTNDAGFAALAWLGAGRSSLTSFDYIAPLARKP
jgi:hypothetical protein